MNTTSLPAPITLVETAAAARDVADAARHLPIARKARLVAAYLDTTLDRMSGEELYRLRWEANVTQMEFAAQLGISQSTVSDMERGRRPVTPEAALLARMLAARARREGRS